MEQEIQQLNERIRLLENLVFAFVKSDNYYFGKHIVLADGVSIKSSTGTGAKVGSATGQKWGFYNVTPVDQPATVVDADGTLADATTKINTIIDRLQELGLIA